jgi:hypothetical protein
MGSHIYAPNWAGPQSYLCFLIAAMTGMRHHTQGYEVFTPRAFYWLRWGLLSFLPQLASNLHPPQSLPPNQVARITGLSHCAWLHPPSPECSLWIQLLITEVSDPLIL